MIKVNTNVHLNIKLTSIENLEDQIFNLLKKLDKGNIKVNEVNHILKTEHTNHFYQINVLANYHVYLQEISDCKKFDDYVAFVYPELIRLRNDQVIVLSNQITSISYSRDEGISFRHKDYTLYELFESWDS